MNISTTTGSYSSNNWYTLDDKILVNFSTAYPDSLAIDSFMNKYSLSLLYEPLDSLPITTGCSYTYIFKYNLPSNQPNGFMYVPELLQDMFEDSSNVVCVVSPNVVNIRRTMATNAGVPFEPNPEVTYDVCGVNDAYAQHQWFLHNDFYDTNNGIPCSPPIAPGTVGADAHICECWNQGLTGNGIKVCTIATGDVDFVTPNNDYVNQPFDPSTMWDCTVQPCVPLVSNPATGAAMSMWSYIAALRNNNFGTAGIAEECILSHIKISDNIFLADASMIRALQKALEMDVDVIATDYVSPVSNGSIKEELYKHYQLGRPMHPGALGTVIIAASGHTETNPTGTTMSHFPACFNLDINNKEPEVIGVIASNVYDKLESGWQGGCQTPYVPNNTYYSYPANYGSQYDVASPAAGCYDATVQSGITPQDVTQVAVVAGVVALLLGDNPYLSSIQIRDQIRSGADKVGGYNYTGPLQHSTEFAAGRINCMNSYLGWALHSNSLTQTDDLVKIATYSNSWELLFKKQTAEDYDGLLLDMSGNLIKKMKIPKGVQNYGISNIEISTGIYFIKLQSSKSSVVLKISK
ncbi:MAG: S8 family peptidase [Bacteroidetes bacterium]|nr:S8 family peptidase [Bacteroidota bacterium]